MFIFHKHCARFRMIREIKKNLRRSAENNCSIPLSFNKANMNATSCLNFEETQRKTFNVIFEKYKL